MFFICQENKWVTKINKCTHHACKRRVCECGTHIRRLYCTLSHAVTFQSALTHAHTNFSVAHRLCVHALAKCRQRATEYSIDDVYGCRIHTHVVYIRIVP